MILPGTRVRLSPEGLGTSLKEFALYVEGKENSINGLRKGTTQLHLCFRRWTGKKKETGLTAMWGKGLQAGKSVAMILETKDGVLELNGIFISMRLLTLRSRDKPIKRHRV